MDESNGTLDRVGKATADEAATLLKAYTDLLRPLRGLGGLPGGLVRFYAHFRYPWERSLSPVCG